jgi:hypothetical protein
LKSVTKISAVTIGALVVGLVGGLIALQRYRAIHDAFHACVYDPNVAGANCAGAHIDYTSVWVILGITGGTCVAMLLFVIVAGAVRIGTSRD